MKLKSSYIIAAIVFLIILDIVGAVGIAMIYREFQQ